MKRFLSLVLLLVSCASWSQAADSPRQFRAGAMAIDITPLQLPVIVNGGMSERTSSTIVDRLHARCLVLDDGVAQAAIVVVDSCMIPRDLLDEAKAAASKATGIPVSQMLISATHAHSAPSVFGCLGSDVDEPYRRFLPTQIAKGIQMAHARLQPARIGWGKDSDPKNVFVRRFLMKPGTARTNRFSGTHNDRAQMNPGFQNPNALKPTGKPDTDVWVLSVQTRSGQPLALLGNYSTHYAGAPSLSADYFGAFCDILAERLAPGDKEPAFVGLMSNGTSGDTNCNNFAEASRREYDRFTVARDVSAAALRAYERIEYFDWVPVVMQESLLTLDIRSPSKEEVAEAKEYLLPYKGRKPIELDEIYARETVLLSEGPQTRELKLQALRLGSLGITAIPNEVYSSTGLAIKRDSPLPATFNIELANGCDGYLAPPEQHKLGGYTCWRARSSCLEVGAEPKVRETLLKLLNAATRARADEASVPSPAAP
ncbi:hypothetical protein [Lignipirellula cremea]|uniref:Neutral/alkaline non-lysosomal ceramidase n=1 Tax=Lignipirellula cremea TaxID=2528010 RepID=A0A518DP04_9BACT|nr:hypothetical protein [Lignipirellula cremea]QDU93569.1 Neutral/alkaline non-lysosomal ceramidase [Lignipirellula cremea]